MVLTSEGFPYVIISVSLRCMYVLLMWAVVDPAPGVADDPSQLWAFMCRRLSGAPKRSSGVLCVCACPTSVAAVARQQHGEPRHRGGSLHFNNKTNIISPQNEVTLLIDSRGVSMTLFYTRGLGVCAEWRAKVCWAAGLLSASTKKLLIYCGAWLELTHSTTLFHRVIEH